MNRFADGTFTVTAYDANGRKIAQTDAATNTTWFGYDALGRLTSVTNALLQVTRYSYDAAGNQTSQVDGLNRRIKRTLPGGQSETMVYDLAGNVATNIDFNGLVITNQYDAMNRLTNRSQGPYLLESYQYDAMGRRTNALVNFQTASYQYDVRNRLSQKTSGSDFSYQYDGNGNLTNLTVNGHFYYGDGTPTTQYGYDALNRLTKVTAGAVTAAYGYDGAGNLQTVQYGNGLTNLCQYDSLNRLTNLVWATNGVTVASFEPQCNAMMSSLFGEKHWYYFASALNSVAVWPFQKGRGFWTLFLGTWAGIIGLCRLAGRNTRPANISLRRLFRHSLLWRQALTYIIVSCLLAGSIGNVEAATYNPVFYFYYTNHLGSTNVMTDRQGNLVQHYEYGSFGAASYIANTSAFPVSNRYTGQIADDETGLYYYGCRYYDPQLGRFIQPDDQIPDIADPQSFNCYTYAANNPLRYTDPTGHDDYDTNDSVDESDSGDASGTGGAGGLGETGEFTSMRNNQNAYMGYDANGTLNVQLGGPPPPAGQPPTQDQAPAPDKNPVVAAPSQGSSPASGWFAKMASIGNVLSLVPFTAVAVPAAIIGAIGEFGQQNYFAGTMSLITAGFGMAGMGSLVTIAKDAGELASISKAAETGGRATTTVLSDVTVISKGKVVGQGDVYLRPTLEGIESGKIAPRDIFQNREGLLPSKGPGYYQEFVHPTPGVSGAGSQRIIRGAGGELYYTPDHYGSFVPLN